ncbi:hypothetical protein NDJ83_12090 [Vibrio alginolyticus]|uniref:hypothetical protein n=1 Tax=Vibrio alginolyticus TaxID=663 RepID=UPI002160C0E9|nr:hypothetical protein [Vibrio alginolyticus]MCS0279971.1 hypothetical protein [Vibrio alginolyticus]
MSTVNEIRNTIDAALRKSSWWQRFIGSQFVSYLALFMAQVVSRCEQAAARALQNSYIATATTRTAILAGAESRGHIGRKSSPSTGKVLATNLTDARITSPSLLQCSASNQVKYTITDNIDIGPGASVELSVSQISIETLTYVVETEENWLTVVVPIEYTDQLHKMVVRVNGEEWAESFKFRNTTGESKVYMETYKSTDQYAIRFGNNINGKAPDAGSTIEIDLWLTDGETTLLDNQKLVIDENQGLRFGSNELALVTSTQITGGEEPEDIESIRSGALYSSIYDNQVVWDGDYKAYIKANIANLVWVEVWGEQGQEKLTGVKDLNNINKIFICAYSSAKSDELLGEEILALFKGKEAYNETYHMAMRKDAPITVAVTGKVHDGFNLSDGEQAIMNALDSLYGKDVKKESSVHLKDIWEAINKVASDNGIYQFNVDAQGILESVPIDTYQYIDIKGSTATLTYPEV